MAKGIHAKKLPLPTERFLDAKQLIVFCHAVTAAGRARFDLTGIYSHGKIRNRRILRFTGAVGNNGRVSRAVGFFNGIQRFGKRTDLIHFDQNRIADLSIDTFFQPFHIRYEKIIANQLP